MPETGTEKGGVIIYLIYWTNYICVPIRLPIYGYRRDILDRGIKNLVQFKRWQTVPNLCQLLPDMDTVQWASEKFSTQTREKAHSKSTTWSFHSLTVLKFARGRAYCSPPSAQRGLPLSECATFSTSRMSTALPAFEFCLDTNANKLSQVFDRGRDQAPEMQHLLD